ncbi:MAG: SDR family NAD(P)-dependent oxidoreductase [Candidatus Altiarchaeota archaeon]|nr:SDR family NAD(P)-dependent oxidoreductase [Candidatus Altiarchaeota archaeon]
MILITGGAGFVGSNLADNFLRKGDSVTIYDNFSRSGSERNAEWLKSNHPKTEIIKADIRDFDSLKKAASRADAIYHTAGQVAVTTSVQNPREDFEINALGTFNVLEAARAARTDPTVIFTSTNKVYGGMENVKVVEKETRYDYESLPNGNPESQPLDFHSPYGCSKGAADQYVRDYARIYGLRSVVFRMSCIYGIRQFGTEDQGWVAYFTLASIFDWPLKIYGDGKQIRDILFISDLVNAFDLATQKISKTKGQVFNMGGGPENTISLLELLKYLESLTGRKKDTPFSDWRPGDQRVYYSDIRKAERVFGWEPKVPKKEGIKRLFDWVQENRSYWG